MNTNGNTGVIIGVIVLLVVLIGGWFVTMREGHGMMAGTEMTATSTSATSSTDMMATSTVPMSGPTTMASGDSVTVANQSAGMSVMVGAPSLSQSGWVAIRDNMGRTLGAALFPAGTQSNVSVPLLRATSAGDRYQALLYFDDGKKDFNLHTETLVENSDGSVAGTMFSVK